MTEPHGPRTSPSLVTDRRTPRTGAGLGSGAPSAAPGLADYRRTAARMASTDYDGQAVGTASEPSKP